MNLCGLVLNKQPSKSTQDVAGGREVGGMGGEPKDGGEGER